MIIIFGTLVWNDDIARHSFHFTKILIFRVVSGLKGQKMAQNDKNSVCLAPYLRNHTWYGHHVYFSRCVFHLFKVLIFWVVRGVYRQKMALNDKNVCPSHSMSWELYLIWQFFYSCKMMISPAIFFVFSKVWFFGFLGGKRAKMTHNYQFQSVTLYQEM